MRSFHTPTPKNPTQFNPKSPIFYPHPQILNFSLFYNENHISPKFHPLSNPISSNPLFHNAFPPSFTQKSTKNFHKFTLPSQLSSLYKGIFTMHYFYVKKSSFNSQIKNFQTFRQRIIIYPINQKNKEIKTMRLTNEEILTQFPSWSNHPSGNIQQYAMETYQIANIHKNLTITTNKRQIHTY